MYCFESTDWCNVVDGAGCGREMKISISQLKYFGRLILEWFQAWKEFFDTKEDLIWFFIEGYKYLPIKLLKIHHENCPKSWKVNDISDNKGKPISPWRNEKSQIVINFPNYHKTLTVKISHNLFPNSSKKREIINPNTFGKHLLPNTQKSN